MKKLLALILTIALVFSLCACGGGKTPETKAPETAAPGTEAPATEAPATEAPATQPSGTTTLMSLGTAGSGGAWYAIGAAMSDLLSNGNIGLQVSCQTTGGGLENCKLVNDNDCEIAITIGYLAYNALNGEGDFEGAKMENLSLLFSGLSNGVMQVVVPANSSIKSFADLKGKKVAVGPAGGGAITTLTAALEYFGVKYSEITPTYVAYDEGVTMMTDGNVDAAVVYGGIPTAAVSTLSASKVDFRMLELTAEEQKAIVDKYTYFVPFTVPAATYDMDHDILTLATPNVVIVSKNLPEDLVYNMCTVLLSEEGIEAIHNSQGSAKGLTIEKAAGTEVIPFHPGALKFYKEKGLIK